MKKCLLWLLIFPLMAEEIEVDYEPCADGVIGFIAIHSFYPDVGRDLQTALRQLQDKGALNGLILDMRMNIGGQIEHIFPLAELFLQNFRNGVTQYTPKILHQRPLVVMLSRATAPVAALLCQRLRHVSVIIGDAPDLESDSKLSFLHKTSMQTRDVQVDIVVPTACIGKFPHNNYPLTGVQQVSVFEWPQTKSVSYWGEMIPALLQNSLLRRKNNSNLRQYYQQLSDPTIPPGSKKQGCGGEDLQKREALNIVKDMLFLTSQKMLNRDKTSF